MAACDAIKPRNGGNDAIWDNRREKHRALLTVGSTTHGTGIGLFMHNLSKNASTTPPVLAAKVSDKSFFRLVLKGDNDGTIPIAVGMELFGDAIGGGPEMIFGTNGGSGWLSPISLRILT